MFGFNREQSRQFRIMVLLENGESQGGQGLSQRNPAFAHGNLTLGYGSSPGFLSLLFPNFGLSFGFYGDDFGGFGRSAFCLGSCCGVLSLILPIKAIYSAKRYQDKANSQTGDNHLGAFSLLRLGPVSSRQAGLN